MGIVGVAVNDSFQKLLHFSPSLWEALKAIFSFCEVLGKNTLDHRLKLLFVEGA